MHVKKSAQSYLKAPLGFAVESFTVMLSGLNDIIDGMRGYRSTYG